MVYITAVHMSPGGRLHEHIEEVAWTNPADGKTGKSTRHAMVVWINGGGVARLKDAKGDVQVGVVNATPPYIRTHADGRWTDNLLALPRY